MSRPGVATREVIWHDAENGAYRADLPLWRELAAAHGGAARVLELGCGTGRVGLDLARAGFEVLGVDSEPALVAELNRRAAERGLAARAVVGDVRALDHGAFDLVLAPMQVLQLLPGRGARATALQAIERSLAGSGRAAVAIVEGDPSGSVEAPAAALPDVAERDGWVYSSLPLGAYVDAEARRIGIRRLRQVVSPAGELSEDVDVTALALLTAAELEAEAAGCGLRPAGRRPIAATREHVGATVVLLERAGGSR